MRIFNTEVTVVTVKPHVTQARFHRKSGYKVGMDCAKKAPSKGFLVFLGGVR